MGTNKSRMRSSLFHVAEVSLLSLVNMWKCSEMKLQENNNLYHIDPP